MSTHPGLGERGAAIYAQFYDANDASRSAVALEAARTADRMDDLDAIIQGRGLLNLLMFRVVDKEITEDYADMNLNVEVKFNSVLSEARQQSVAFSGLIKALAPKDSAPAVPVVPEVPKTGADMLAEKRAERAAGK